MTPTPPGVDQDSTPPGDTDFAGTLVPIPLTKIPGLPSPHDMRLFLETELAGAVGRIRTDRGDVTVREDTYELVTSLHGFGELMTDYSKAFVTVSKTVKGYEEEELHEAVGDADGIPAENMTVPSAGGDIKITRKFHNEYNIDLEQVVSALAAQVSAEWHDRATVSVDNTDLQSIGHPFPQNQPEQFAITVALRAIEFMGAAKPKVTQVKALAAEMSRSGDHKLAAVVTGAIGKTQHYDGIDVKRSAVA